MTKVTIILPCHNEEKILSSAINSLKKQLYWDYEIIICLDNCTDKSEEIANSFNEEVKVFKSVNNEHKKAGALNQLMSYHLKNMGTYVLVMDADTILDKNAVREGVKFLNKKNEHAAVCSMAGILKPEKKNILWYLQNIEYGFGDTNFIENQDNVYVCRGMYSMYRKSALVEVFNDRGFVYDVNSITEDYELTLKLKTLKYKISNCKYIKAFTDVPLNLKEFWIQRKRWIKGGVDDLKRYGYNKTTAKDINGLIFYILLIFLQVYFITQAVIVKEINLYWMVIVVGLYYLNAILRVKYVQNKNFIMYLILFSIVPMMLYAALDSITTIYSVFLSITNKKLNWR